MVDGVSRVPVTGFGIAIVLIGIWLIYHTHDSASRTASPRWLLVIQLLIAFVLGVGFSWLDYKDDTSAQTSCDDRGYAVDPMRDGVAAGDASASARERCGVVD